MPHFSLTNQLTGAGWAEARVSDRETTIRLDVSYVGEGIEAAAWAAIALLQNAEHSEFEWLDEPGSSRWVLDKQGTRLQITVRSGSYFSNQREQEREVLLCAWTTPLKFAIQVWDALRHLMEELGVEGYAELWQRGFPLDSYQRLDHLIREAKRAARATRRAERKHPGHRAAST